MSGFCDVCATGWLFKMWSFVFPFWITVSFIFHFLIIILFTGVMSPLPPTVLASGPVKSESVLGKRALKRVPSTIQNLWPQGVIIVLGWVFVFPFLIPIFEAWAHGECWHSLAGPPSPPWHYPSLLPGSICPSGTFKSILTFTFCCLVLLPRLLFPLLHPLQHRHIWVRRLLSLKIFPDAVMLWTLPKSTIKSQPREMVSLKKKKHI